MIVKSGRVGWQIYIYIYIYIIPVRTQMVKKHVPCYIRQIQFESTVLSYDRQVVLGTMQCACYTWII